MQQMNIYIYIYTYVYIYICIYIHTRLCGLLRCALSLGPAEAPLPYLRLASQGSRVEAMSATSAQDLKRVASRCRKSCSRTCILNSTSSYVHGSQVTAVPGLGMRRFATHGELTLRSAIRFVLRVH